MRSKRRWDRLHIVVPAAPPATLDETTIAEQVDYEKLGSQVNRALGRLSQRDRDAFLLRALDDLTYPEIGEILQIPPGTVGSRINRARRRLREYLAEVEEIRAWVEETDIGENG